MALKKTSEEDNQIIDKVKANSPRSPAGPRKDTLRGYLQEQVRWLLYRSSGHDWYDLYPLRTREEHYRAATAGEYKVPRLYIGVKDKQGINPFSHQASSINSANYRNHSDPDIRASAIRMAQDIEVGVLAETTKDGSGRFGVRIRRLRRNEMPPYAPKPKKKKDVEVVTVH